MKEYSTIIIALISLTVGAIFFYLMSQTKQLPAAEYALHYQQARPISDFNFTDESGQDFENKHLQGKWSFIFFGYTSCPDVCPMTLQKLGFIYDKITAIASNSQVILVSVDPQRDSREKLAQYIAYFNPNFKALRAEHNVLFPFSRNLGLMYAITRKSNINVAEEGYWVDHSTSLALINPTGKVEAIFKPEQEVGQVPYINTEELLSDYQRIVALYQ
ncbi:MAG: SCO family protein [Colwellia sp.]